MQIQALRTNYMQSSKTLRRPTNWQDFESLCKKLWGEIWDCAEIKKNGRSGQNQHGVDVYGIPRGEISYYGIQCKGKDEYTDKQFSEDEINTEISNAKSFTPALKKFYFATTAVKDAKIEAFVRQKNIDHLQAGLFEVHIFSWEDIVDLIDENRQTHDWYVKSQNFRIEQNAILTFQDGNQEIQAVVKFNQKVTEYRQKIVLANPLFNNLVFPSFARIDPILIHSPFFDNSTNHSYYEFFFRLHNIGNGPIEEPRIFFDFDGDYQDLVRVRNWSGMIAPTNTIPYDTFLNETKKGGRIVPRRNILISEESIGFNDLRIKPLHEPSKVKINWRLNSRDYKTEGQLVINFHPEIIRDHDVVLVEDPTAVRIVQGNIEDHITRR
ncbi:MAG: hypothetical protein EOP04_06240 [Proteobacteria bacterium]|nr:MAG: hypothetical protein EOP04_06240 [Pseudomonadota bacterium]